MTARVITFYSYKGGVGRSFALANVGTILAQWGFRVLLVDWDIEAPGLDHYFRSFTSGSAPGVIDFIQDCIGGKVREASEYQVRLEIPDLEGELILMSAAGVRDGNDYTEIVQKIDWDDLFKSYALGEQIEALRTSWLAEFDAVLVDSRTGITDFSGITTVQLPDAIVFQFTANRQSLLGCCDVVRRAKDARLRLPVDRATLLTIPVPSRFEQREEYDRAQFWRKEFARELAPFLSDWVPKALDPIQMIDALSIPYVARWTFGEELAVLEEPASTLGTRSPSFPVSYALETVAAVIANRFDRIDLLYSSRDEYVLTARETGRTLERLSESSSDGLLTRPKVFISYDHRDRSTAEKIAKFLNPLSDVFLDRSLASGDRWDMLLEESLEQSDILIVLIGKYFGKFQTIEAERFLRSSLRSSQTRRRPIIPILMPGGSLLDAPSFLTNYQMLRLKSDRPLEAQLVALTDALPELMTSDGTPEIIEVPTDLGWDLAASRKRLEIAEALASRDPRNLQRQRELSIRHNQIGDILAAQNDISSALYAYREGLEIAEELSARDPANPQWRRDISINYGKIGDILVAQGDISGALYAFHKGLDIAEELAARDPANPQWRRDVSINYDKIGDILVAQGDNDGALNAYRRGLEIAEELAAYDPANLQWRRDLSISFNRIGGVLAARADNDGALNAYRKSLEIAEELAAHDPTNSQWRRDLSISFNRIGRVLAARGDNDGALTAYRKGLEISESLTSSEPANARQRDS